METLLTFTKSTDLLHHWYPTHHSQVNPIQGHWFSETLILELTPPAAQGLRTGEIAKADIDSEAKDLALNISEAILHDNLEYPEEVHLTETRVSDNVTVFTNNYSNIPRYRRNSLIVIRQKTSLHIQLILG